MYIEKHIYYKINDDDCMDIYEKFSNYCYKEEIEENYNNFLSFYEDTCLEDDLKIDKENTHYDNIDDEDSRHLFYLEMMRDYNKDYILIQKLENEKKGLEQKYKKIENR